MHSATASAAADRTAVRLPCRRWTGARPGAILAAMHPHEIELFRRAPGLIAEFAHTPLATLPTAVERVRLGTEGEDRTILVKRDDLCADGYAGNKVRKLEFLLAEAAAAGAARLITAGAAGSHHAFATAYHGRRLGFDVSLVLFPQSLTPHVRDMVLLDQAVGAELCWASRMEAVPWGMWRARHRYRAQPALIVPPGGSNVTGTLGYVSAGLELAAQIESGAAARPSSIYVAAGTLGTVAGMAIGLAWAGLSLPVIATRITSRIVTNERVLASLVRGTRDRLSAAGVKRLPDADSVLRLVELRHDQIGRGYGRSTEAAERAIRVFAAAGLTLDTTYTAKSAASLLADPEQTAEPLFWHTLSAVEPRELLDNVSPADLPTPFARYLAGA
jgi:D-cysteine desulfhydrase